MPLRRIIPRLRKALPDPEARQIHSLTPEDRRREALQLRSTLSAPVSKHVRSYEVVRRVATGTFNDGFLYAGNLAYMSMLAIFPFFITGAAIFAALGEGSERAASINAILLATPPVVAEVIEPVARNVIDSRQGWLLWVGGVVGLWTVGSLIETIRAALHDAYGTTAQRPFWQYRLRSIAIIIGAVFLAMIAFSTQVIVTGAEQFVYTYLPWAQNISRILSIGRFLPFFVLFGALYITLVSLMPQFLVVAWQVPFYFGGTSLLIVVVAPLISVSSASLTRLMVLSMTAAPLFSV